MRRKRNKTVAQGKPRKIIVEPLEPRTLFSADVVSASLALDLIEDSSPEQHNWLADTSQSLFAVFDDKADAYASENSVLNDYSSSELIGFEEQASEVIADPAPIFEPSRQLIVIDARVDNSDELLQDVLNNAPSGTDFDVIELHEGSDGIEQITSALNAQGDQKYNAVHIIAHGSDAEVLLGSTQLNSANLQQYENELSSWRTDLTLDADILLYGCDVAQTHAGQEFVDQISQWTGADIASSSDLTGHADLGGNWELEYTVGEVETDLPFSLKTTQNWTGTLASGTNSFWLSTQFDIAPGNGGPGLDSWTAQEIVEIGEPNRQMHEEVTPQVAGIVGDDWIVSRLNGLALSVGDPEGAADFGLKVRVAECSFLQRCEVFQLAVNKNLLLWLKQRILERLVLTESIDLAAKTF